MQPTSPMHAALMAALLRRRQAGPAGAAPPMPQPGAGAMPQPPQGTPMPPNATPQMAQQMAMAQAMRRSGR
jgi:hypothetical protein